MWYKFLIAVFISLSLNKQTTAQVLKADSIRINGILLYVETTGEGEPLLIINGGPGLSHDYLLPHVLPLAARHKLIFYDQRASGKTDIHIDTSRMRIIDFVEDIEGLRKYFNIRKINIVGHSWGGFLAAQYAIKYRKNIKSLVFWDAMPMSSHLRNVMLEKQKEILSDEERENQVKISRSEDFRNGDPTEIKRLYWSIFKSSVFVQKKVYKLNFYFNQNYMYHQYLLSFLGKELVNYDFYPKLKKIKVPALIFHGEYDPMPIESSELLRDGFPNSEIILLKECGHMPFLEKPDELFGRMEAFYTKISNRKK